MENAKVPILRSTFTIRADVYLSAETAGVTSQKRTSNGEKNRIS